MRKKTFTLSLLMISLVLFSFTGASTKKKPKSTNYIYLTFRGIPSIYNDVMNEEKWIEDPDYVPDQTCLGGSDLPCAILVNEDYTIGDVNNRHLDWEWVEIVSYWNGSAFIAYTWDGPGSIQEFYNTVAP